MYASVSNQLIHLLHYVFSFLFVFVFMPRWLFGSQAEEPLENAVILYIKMVLFSIIVGYLSVLLGLFEVLFIAAVWFLWLVRRIRSKRKRAGEDVALEGWTALFYDWLDGKFSPWTMATGQAGRKYRDTLSAVRSRFSSPRTAAETVLLLAVLAVSVYTRFYDALTSPAPALSDGYVTLAWLKYIDARQLFHDGMYPQGFHIILTYLFKFAAVDALYVLKYTGPLNMVLVIFGLYYAVSRISGSRAGGILAAAVFGLWGPILEGGSWVRQASTNSQEFAFVFIFPALYYFYLYMKERKTAQLITALAATAVVGLVHAFAFAYLALGIASLLAAFCLLQGKAAFSGAWRICVGGLVSAAISVLPLGIGVLMGKGLHAASAEYLTGTAKTGFSYPPLYWFDWMALAAIAILLLSSAIGLFKGRKRTDDLFAAIFGGGMFIVLYFGGHLTGSVLIDSRSPEIWALTIPFCIGMGACACFRIFGDRLSRRILETVFCVAVCFSTLVFIPPNPILPYKMEWDSSVEQYLRISTEFQPKSWIVVSQQEGYDLVIGKGFHLYLSDLLQNFDPSGQILTSSDGKRKLDQPDIFIYQEKQVFKVSETNSIYGIMKPKYEEREQQYTLLDDWIRKRNDAWQDVSIFYEDGNLRIYRLHRQVSRQEINSLIWER